MAKKYIQENCWLLSILSGVAILHLNLIWKTTENIDLVATSSFYWGAIIWLLWCRRDRLLYRSKLSYNNIVGLFLLCFTLSKTLTLFSFESQLLSLFPLTISVALILIVSGFKFGQYKRELFFAWFLFFPEGVIGQAIDGLVKITIINAKVATYLLYYVGFDVVSKGNQVMLSLPESGQFKAIVDYPCAGVPMMLLMLKFALLLICLAPLKQPEKILIPTFSVILGFLLGVIRVSILTLLISNPNKFDYWHGSQGTQIFSTLAITIFAGFCYWILERRQIVGTN